MIVHWTDTALELLVSIHEYFSRTSAPYADHVVDRLTRRSEQIAEFPLSGRMVPEVDMPQIREVIEGPFRIIYHIKADQVDVLAIVHGSQDFPWQDH